MKLRLLLLVFLVGTGVGLLTSRATHAHATSQQALARGVTTDAQWNTAMGTIFSAANWPGVDPTALAFLRSYFVQVVHVGIP